MTKSIGDVIKERTDVQHFVEICLSYLYDQVLIDGPEVEYLKEELDMDTDEIVDLFSALGYEQTL